MSSTHQTDQEEPKWWDWYTSIVFQGRCSLSWEVYDLREDPLLEGCDLREDQLSSAQPDLKESTAGGC